MGVHHSGFPPWFGMGDARLSGSPLVLSLHWCLLMKCMTSVFVVILYPQCAQTISWWLQVFLMVFHHPCMHGVYVSRSSPLLSLHGIPGRSMS